MAKFRVVAKETWDYYLEADSAEEAKQRVVEEMEGKCFLWETEIVTVTEDEDEDA